ncbi:MAG: restriction endonuclease [Candidatus Paceibacterota bacterium]
MARKKQNGLFEIIIPCISIYAFYLLILWFSNKQEFWKWLFIGLGIIILIIFIYQTILSIIRQKKKKLIIEINRLDLNIDINNFINRAGKEKGKESWRYMDYGFNTDKMNIFIKTLAEKGLKIKNIDDLEFVLKRFIDTKEEAIIKNGFESTQYKFSSLSGTEFENLLVRLYESMGYLVEHPGSTGDQGGDLILNKNGQRILVQAKRYKGSIGNGAVQEAVAAKKYYDCNRTMLIGSASFTRGALDLANYNEVELVEINELRGLLLSHLGENWN